MDAFATPEELRLFLNTEDVDDERADFFLKGVSHEIRRGSKQSFDSVVTDTFVEDGPGISLIFLPGLPVVDVLSVSEGGSELDASGYEWSRKGIVRRLGGLWGNSLRSIEVQYQHGFDEVPDDIKLLTLRVAARGYVNPTAVTNEGMGGYNAGYGYDSSRMPMLTNDEWNLVRSEYMAT